MFKSTERGLEFTEEIELTEEDMEEIGMLFAEATSYQCLDKIEGVWADHGNGFGMNGFSIVENT